MEKPERIRVNPRDFMGDLSAHAMGEKHKRRVAVWTYAWGYTTAGLIRMLLEKEAYGWTTNAIKRGLLRATNTASGSPRQIITLTEKGQALAEQHMPQHFDYVERDPYKINQATIWHQLLAQRVTIKAMNSGEVNGIATERQDAAQSRRGEKRPDVVWRLRDNTRVGVEMELSGKWERRLDEFVAGIITALSPAADGRHARFDKFIVVTNSDAIVKRYEAAVSKGAYVRLWRKNSRGVWEVCEVNEVPDWLGQKIEFRKIEP